MFLTLLRKPRLAAVNPPLSVNFSTLSHPYSEPQQPLSNPALQSLVLSHYRHGKFRRLLQNVVASPALLLTACHNLRKHRPPGSTPPPPPLTLDSVSTHFLCLRELSSQLSNDSLDVASCCFSFPPQSPKGTPLVLPNLKLKVVLEAIRVVLEAIYDDRFVTFSYGGRAAMGRHTAIRYLKNSVENPSWWFSVKFDSALFGPSHVDKLCLILEEKIEDNSLLNLIRKLFECKIVTIDLGGICIGRGLPQECALSSIFINIYFNGFDKEIQELRLKTNQENPRISETELVSGFYKPLKLYAIRYLNDILIITSGTKKLTLDLKNHVVKLLTDNLDLKVDRSTTVIHSAVSEKIYFMGMELRAVAPSVLRPPMTDKASRARKKHLRQLEVRLLELKNKRERNRKVLGMKILSHLYRKSRRRSKGPESDFRIENEVRDIFSTWANEVVHEVLSSVDLRWEWHRKLTYGDFLSLGRVRDQLPNELVNSYDNFQNQVEKYLNPVKAKKVLEERLRRTEQKEEEQYSQKTVNDLTRRVVKVDAPLEILKQAVKTVGITNKMGRPRPLSLLMVLEDADIIKWYAGVGKRWLDFFCCCNNFRKVKIIVSYHLRFSCLLTLAEKHEATKSETIRHFTKDLKVGGDEGVCYFPSEREVKMMGEGNLMDPKPVEGCLTLVLTRLSSDEPCRRCVAHFCNKTDTIVYRIHLLQEYLNLDPFDGDRWIPLMGAIHDSLHGKCAPLCSEHVHEMYMGRLTLQDVDCTGFVDVD